jgi:Uma2 family endonuclease
MYQQRSAMVSLQDYLRSEEQSEWKHEFVDGEVIEMTGASTNHQLIVSNLVGTLLQHIKATDCNVFPGIKVHVELMNSVYYPDVVVRCGRPLGNVHMLTDPTLIVEVLSGSTALVDRREKRVAYRALPSVREYVIVDQYRQHVEVFRKDESPHWLEREHEVNIGTSEVIFKSLLSCGQLVIPLREIYAGTNIPPEGTLEVHDNAEQYYLAQRVEMPRELPPHTVQHQA